MTVDEFRATVGGPEPPPNLPPLLGALWHDAAGNWDTAHRLAQDVGTADGAWVHAYLHRKEGDIGNAGYWYRQADRPVATAALDAEWEAIAAELLARDD
jgi:hypothetical protein